jgi:uncharacterized protein
MELYTLIFSADLGGLENALQKNPALANGEIPLPENPDTAPPLHRICDGVFSGLYTENKGLLMARLLVKHGAKINPQIGAGKDSPLTAACSLHCDQIALFFIEQGADIDHPGCHGGTALHWSAWCGRDTVTGKILEMTNDVNRLCTDFKSTPLFWAIHGHRFGGEGNRYHQAECARLLLEHGADPNIPNFEGYLPEQLLQESDTVLLELFRNYKK